MGVTWQIRLNDQCSAAMWAIALQILFSDLFISCGHSTPRPFELMPASLRWEERGIDAEGEVRLSKVQLS